MLTLCYDKPRVVSLLIVLPVLARRVLIGEEAYNLEHISSWEKHTQSTKRSLNEAYSEHETVME